MSQIQEIIINVPNEFMWPFLSIVVAIFVLLIWTMFVKDNKEEGEGEEEDGE